jgi:hypothetical protein
MKTILERFTKPTYSVAVLSSEPSREHFSSKCLRFRKAGYGMKNGDGAKY